MKCSLVKNNDFIETLESAYYKNYETFYLVSPDGILDSIAGLENLSNIFSRTISFRTIICYECLSYFECEEVTLAKCPKCQVVNAIIPEDNIGRKVLIIVCFHCRNRNIAHIDSLYVQCYLCNSINSVHYCYNCSLGYVTNRNSGNGYGYERNDAENTIENGNALETLNSNGEGRNCERRMRRRIKMLMLGNMCKCVKIKNAPSGNNIRDNNSSESEKEIDGQLNEENAELNNNIYNNDINDNISSTHNNSGAN